MKTPDQRGPYGRWLVAARLGRGLTTADLARDALRAAGIDIAKSTYAEYESGTKQPSKNHLPELERFYGPFSDPLAGSPSGDTATGMALPRGERELAALLIEQTRAITALVDELRQERSERASAAERLERLQAVVDQLVERAVLVAVLLPVAARGDGESRRSRRSYVPMPHVPTE